MRILDDASHAYGVERKADRLWRNPLSAHNGFSVIELVMAMSIFTIMSLALYFVFDRANQVWTNGQVKTDEYQNARTALDLISREITTAIIATGGPTSFSANSIYRPYLWSSDATTAIAGNNYDRDQIFFVIPRLNALYEVGYFIDDNSTTADVRDDALTRRSSSDAATNFSLDASNFGSSDKFAFKVTDLNFSFIYKSGGAYTTATAWDSRMAATGASSTATTADDGKLPEFIEVTLRVADQSTLQKYGGNPPLQERKTFKTTIPMNTRNLRND